MANNADANIATQNTNLSRDYFELITKHYKAIIATIAAGIPILGAALTLVFYLHDKSYLEYYNISEQWVNIELSKSVYNLIYKGSMVFIMLLPNTIALAPLLFEKETRKKVKFEFWFTVVSAIIIGLISFPIKAKISWSYSKTLIALVLGWILMFGFPVIVSLINVIVTAFSVLIFHPKRTFKYLWTRLRHNIRIKTIFHNIANGIDKMNKVSSEKIQNQPSDENIVNKNKALYLLLVIFIVVFVVFVLFIGSLGKTKADEERSFSVIKPSTIEQYDDLKPNSNGESPYIQLNKRKVNAKVVLSENDDSYLVINAYLDEKENDLKLYLFSSEQTVIEKNDIIVYKIELSDKNNKDVIP